MTKKFYIILAAVFFFRLLYAFIVPFDLVADEAYYWDWGRQLSWGYYSKPPMIAWLNRGFGELLGNYFTTLKIAALLFGTGGVLLTFLLAKRMFNETVAFWACLAMLASPGNAALNLIFTIDAPFLFFWSFALFVAWRCYGEGSNHHAWWLTLAIGLGLLSKQMMFAFMGMLLLFFALSKRDRKTALSIKTYIIFLAGTCFLLPVLYWNSQNDWITFQHTAHHFQSKPITALGILARMGEFLGVQLLLISPITFTLLIYALYRTIRDWKNVSRETIFLFSFGGVALIFVLFMCIRQSINPNWPAAFYCTMLVLLSAWVWQKAENVKIQTWFKRGVYLGAFLAVVTYLYPLGISVLNMEGTRLDVALRIRGWKEVCRAASPVVRSLQSDTNSFILCVGTRQTASQLAFYLEGQPRIYRMNEDAYVDSQYDLWGLPDKSAFKNAIVILDETQPVIPDKVAAYFGTITYVNVVEHTFASGEDKAKQKGRQLKIYRATGYKGSQ